MRRTVAMYGRKLDGRQVWTGWVGTKGVQQMREET